MTVNHHQHAVLIIGAGSDGAALLDIFSREDHIKVAGIVDTDPDAPAVKQAMDLGIEMYADIETALENCGNCIIFNMACDRDPAELSAQNADAGNAIGGHAAKFFRNIISALQREKFELLKSRMRLEAVINNIRECIISIDSNGIIEDANPHTANIFGYEADELIGRNIKILIPEPDRGQRDSYLPESERTGEKHVIGHYREVAGLHKNGKQFPIEINMAEMELGGLVNYVGTVRDITERKITEEKLTHLALHDQLTELPNRKNFLDKLEFSLFSAQRIKSLVALLYIDLDGFKKMNDTLGHAVGDRLLKEVALRLIANTRRSDIPARLGGDEFTVILNHLKTADDASFVADKIIKAIHRPVILDGKICNIGASIGIAIYPDHTENINDLINAADKAMYRAKINGRNQCQIWNAYPLDSSSAVSG